MEDILPTVCKWLERGEPAAMATIVEVERKAPRGPGAAMAVSARGEIVGSLSGGCVESALVQEASPVIASGEARMVSFGITDDQAFGIGLPCGGTIHVFLERVAAGEVLPSLAAAVAAGRAGALVTAIGGAGSRLRPGTKLLVFEEETAAVEGSTGDRALDEALAREARAALARGASERRSVGDVEVFVRSFCPPPTLYVIGAVHPAAEVCQAAKLLGFHVVVCDPRSPFATPERLPAADEIVHEWPDAYLARQRLGSRDAVCVLTHDIKFDVPALKVALSSAVGYVGAMGSRKNQARRVEMLREEGVSEAEIARIFAPIGLDIGAKTPAEIAVSIVAEIVASRNQPAAAREGAVSKRLAR